MSSFAEKLRQAMFDKHCKAVDVVRGTKIGASVISKYLSGMNQPSRDNLLALGKFLEVTPEWLVSSSDAPESKNTSQSISTHKDKIIELLERMVAEKDEQIISLKAEVKQWEDMATKISEKNSQKTKQPINPNKQKVGFLKRRKPKK